MKETKRGKERANKKKEKNVQYRLGDEFICTKLYKCVRMQHTRHNIIVSPGKAERIVKCDMFLASNCLTNHLHFITSYRVCAQYRVPNIYCPQRH